jgi:hypothetical protein
MEGGAFMRKFGRLREKIKELFGNQKSFAHAMDMNVSTLNFKLNSKAEWTLPEIEKACELLHISVDKVKDYFFYE